MYFAIIDCGTTNTRVYILNEDFKIITRSSKKVGVKDTVITGSNRVLKEGLKELFGIVTRKAGIEVKDLKLAIASGMITSEIGLFELPHLPAPAGIDDLAGNIKYINDPDIFPLGIPLILIRGIKNSLSEPAVLRNLRKMDFMRGEETQVAGILSKYNELPLPVIVIVLSSHTKYININQKKEITGSLTTVSGQIYEAVKKETSIGKSIVANKPEESEGEEKTSLDEEIIATAYESINHAGFLRTLLMPRFMDVLMDTAWDERKMFVETAIAAEDLRVLKEFQELNFCINSSYILVGNRTRCEIFSYLLKEFIGVDKGIREIYNKDEIDELTVRGAVEIARAAGYLS